MNKHLFQQLMSRQSLARFDPDKKSASVRQPLCLCLCASENQPSPGQTIATSQRNISQHCWPSICKLRPNGLTQQIATLSGTRCCARLAATCRDMLRVENRTSAHAWACLGATLLHEPGQTTTTSCNIHKSTNVRVKI